MRRHVELRGDHVVQQGVAGDLLARAAGGMGFPFAAAVGSHEEQPTRVRPISVVASLALTGLVDVPLMIFTSLEKLSPFHRL